jgi:uncharacterized repeat protein (TIGR01451 family)
VLLGAACSLIGAGLLAVGASGAAPLPAFVEIPNSPFENVGVSASSVLFSPDGRLLANTAGAGVVMFSVGANGTLTVIPGSPFKSDVALASISESIAFSPSGGFIALAVYNYSYVVMFQVQANGTLQQVSKMQPSNQGALRGVAFSPDGTMVAVSGNVAANPPVAGANEVTTYSVTTGGILSNERRYALPANISGPQDLTFNPSGTLLAVANQYANSVSVFPVANGTLGPRMDTPLPSAGAGSTPFAVAFNPSGTLLAVSDYSSNLVSVFPVHPDGTLGTRTDVPTGTGPSSVAFNSSGTLLATGNRNNLPYNLSVFEVAGDVTLTPVSGSPFSLRNATSPLSVGFSPIAPLLASGNGAGTHNVSVFSPPAALEITKAAPARVTAGHVLTYTVTVRNVSSVFPASGPVVDDLTGVLDQAVLVGTPTATVGTVTPNVAAKTLTWDGTLAPGATATISYSVRVDASSRGGLLADRIIGPPGSNCDGGAPAAAPCTTETQIVRPVPPPPPPPTPHADLALSKTASTVAAHPGDEVQYTLLVRNLGPDDATGVTVVDPTPPGLFVLAATAGGAPCAIAAEQLSCTLGNVGSGGEALVLVTARVAQNATGTVSNLADVFGDQADPDPSNNTARGDVTVTPLPPPPDPDPGPQPVSNLVVAKQVNRTRAQVGTRLTYTITVTNRGAAAEPANDVRVIDASRLPVRLLSAHASRGSCSIGRPTRCRLGTLAPRAHATIRIQAVATVAGAIVNAASVTSGSWDPTPDTGIALARTQVVVAPRRRPHVVKPPHRRPPHGQPHFTG